LEKLANQDSWEHVQHLLQGGEPSLLQNQVPVLQMDNPGQNEQTTQPSIIETPQQQEKDNKRIYPESSQTISDMEEDEQQSKRQKTKDQE
jgi:hypothetical protein